MSLVVDDNFGGYPSGYTFPSPSGPVALGPWYQSLGPAQVIGGTNSILGLQPPNSFAPPALQSVVLGAIDDYLPVPVPLNVGLIGFSYLYAGGGSDRSYLFRCNCYNGIITGFSGFLFTLSIEDDGSLSLLTPLGYMQDPLGGVANSMLQSDFVLSPSIWNYIQINFSIVSTIVGITAFSVAGATVIVNGNEVVKGSLDTGRLYTNAPGINSIGFASGFGFNCLVTNVTLDTSPIAGYPYPATPPLPLGRVSQIPLEWMKLPSDPSARVSQIPIEWLKLPANPRARVTQLVIEVLGNRPSGGSGGGWNVKES